MEDKENMDIVAASTPARVEAKRAIVDTSVVLVQPTLEDSIKFGKSQARKSIFCMPLEERKKFLKNMVSGTRAAKLFELLTKPPLLYNPIYNTQMPFNRRNNSPLRRIPMKQRGKVYDPDPCLLSLDGFVDMHFALRHMVEYFITEETNSTVYVANAFLKRLHASLEHLDILRVCYNDFTIGEHIGNGAYGCVRIVKEKHPPHRVLAMKSQQKNIWLCHQYDGQQMLLERTVLAQAAVIGNPWLPNLHYAFQDEDSLHLVMDYEPGGDMYIYLSKAGQYLDLEMIQFYAAEVVEAIHSLHKMGYIHCDIKPENFAIERSGHLKLLDFGSAIRLDPDGRCVCPTMVGTKEYLNIELLSQREHDKPILVGCEYDYWAIGVFIYELFYGASPFYDEDDSRMMEKIKRFPTTLQFPANDNITDEAQDLIRSLITFPNKRLTYESVTAHAFFREIDFTSLRQKTPVYIPDVAEDGDPSKFNDGKTPARTRDEAITNIGGKDDKMSRAEMIKIAVATPEEEPVPEIEEVCWDGEPCLRDLPFIGFSYMPGLTKAGNTLINQNTSLNDSISKLSVKSLVTKPALTELDDENLMVSHQQNLQADLEKDCLIANLNKRIQTLTAKCDHFHNVIQASKIKPLVFPDQEPVDKTTLKRLNALQEEYNKLILSTEVARRAKIQNDELLNIINQLKVKTNSKTLDEDDVLSYLSEALSFEDPTVSDASLQHDQPRKLIDKVLCFLLEVVRSYQNNINNLEREKNLETKSSMDKIYNLNSIVFQLSESLTKMNHDWHEKEESYTAKIENLKDLLEDTKVERTKLNERYDEYAGKYFALKDEMDEIKKRSTKREEEFSRLFRIVTGDAKDIFAQTAVTLENNSFGDRVHTVAARYEEAQEELGRLRRLMEDTINQHKNEQIHFQDELEHLKKENRRLIDLEVIQLEERNHIDKNIKALEKERNDLTLQITGCRTELAVNAQTIQLNEKAIKELKESVTVLQTANDSLQSQLDDLEGLKMSKSLSNMEHEHSREVENLKCRLNAADNELLSVRCREGALKKQLKSNQDLIETLYTEIGELKKENDISKEMTISLSPFKRQSEQSEASEHMQLLLKQLKDEKIQLLRDLEQAKLSSDQMRANNRELSSKKEYAMVELQRLQYDYESVMDQMEVTRNSYQEENEKLCQKIEQQAKLILHMRTLIPEEKLYSASGRNQKTSSGKPTDKSLGSKVKSGFFKTPTQFFGASAATSLSRNNPATKSSIGFFSSNKTEKVLPGILKHREREFVSTVDDLPEAYESDTGCDSLSGSQKDFKLNYDSDTTSGGHYPLKSSHKSRSVARFLKFKLNINDNKDPTPSPRPNSAVICGHPEDDPERTIFLEAPDADQFFSGSSRQNISISKPGLKKLKDAFFSGKRQDS